MEVFCGGPLERGRPPCVSRARMLLVEFHEAARTVAGVSELLLSLSATARRSCFSWPRDSAAHEEVPATGHPG